MLLRNMGNQQTNQNASNLAFVGNSPLLSEIGRISMIQPSDRYEIETEQQASPPLGVGAQYITIILPSKQLMT